MELPGGEASSLDSALFDGVSLSFRAVRTRVVNLLLCSVPDSKARTLSGSEDLDTKDEEEREKKDCLGDLPVLGNFAVTGASAWLGTLTPSISLGIGREWWLGVSGAPKFVAVGLFSLVTGQLPGISVSFLLSAFLNKLKLSVSGS